ncbi:MAG: TIGR03905 family TSCPD domain-containing protein [Clostridia bacterium]|nr:TIGR03905 family TSCPD domain-containing protein [Clostridia bacterium]
MRHQYTTKGTCSTQIQFDLEDNIVHNVTFVDGCNGNLQALGRLVEGFSVDEIEEKLKDIRCGSRSTSCAEQLCIGIRQAYEQ